MVATQKEIIVFSPHLDDAALGCSDHILAWKKLGLQVRVVTIFTKLSFPSKSPTQGSPSDLELKRWSEDKQAMNLLGVSWNHLSFADWTFRRNYEKPCYICGRPKRCASNVSILGALQKAITPFAKRGSFVVPLGIGGHIDHLLVREAAENRTELSELCYYVDYPYALSILNWTLSDLMEVIAAKKSIKIMSNAKRQLLKKYTSQIPQIFSHTRLSMPWIIWTIAKSYPEIVLYHKRIRLRHERTLALKC